MKVEAIQVDRTYVNKKGQKRTVHAISISPRFDRTVQFYRDEAKECVPNYTSLESFAAWARTEVK